MHWKNIIGAAALVGATTLITSQVVSQQDPGAEGREMWQQWMELAKPGPQHAEMAKRAGKWEQESRHWMYPGAEPEKSASVAERKVIMGGRYLLETIRGEETDMDGQKMTFEGMGINGYDNFTKKYVFAWVDNMGTMIMIGEGTADPTGKVITFFSTLPDPATGGTAQIKSVARHISDDKEVFEMYGKQPDGNWFKNFEIISTRSR